MNWSEVTTGLFLFRHGEVTAEARDLCYGQSDVALSELGQQQSKQIADFLAGLPLQRVYHSGLIRTAQVVQYLAEKSDHEIEEVVQLQERDFGEWELQSWEKLFQQTGDEMMKMLTDPDHYRAGGGETTFEQRDRVWNWFEQLNWDRCQAAITHGGVIAALLGTIFQKPVEDWIKMIPPYGSFVYIPVKEGAGLCSSLEFKGSPSRFSD